MKKIILILLLPILAVSCELEPEEIKNLSESKKGEVLERGYYVEEDFAKKDGEKVQKNAEKTPEKPSKTDEKVEKNEEKSIKKTSLALSEKKIIDEIKSQYLEYEKKALEEVKTEIEKIRKDEVHKIKVAIDEYPGLTLSMKEKYQKEEEKKLDDYLNTIEKKEILKAKLQIKTALEKDIEDAKAKF